MVQQDVPTGREVRAHTEQWRELPERERPEFQVEWWNNAAQEWQGIRYVISNFPDDDTPQPGLRLVPLPQPETEWVHWSRAMGRRHVSGDLLGDIAQVYPETSAPAGIYVEYELPELSTTGNPQRRANGTVEVLVEPESATPATDSVPTSAVASSERATEVVGGGGGAGGTTPTRPDPPEGWVVCRDEAVVARAKAAGRAKVCSWLDNWLTASSADPAATWLADGRYAVPVDMVAEHVCRAYERGRCAECGEPTADPGDPWVPSVGDRVLATGTVAGQIYDDGDIKVMFASADGPAIPIVASSSLRPFPEDGE